MHHKHVAEAVGLVTTAAGLLIGAPGDTDAEQRPLVAPPSSSGDSSSKPNIILVLTDDQDMHMNSLDYGPLIKKHLIDEGTLFKRHYCTTAVCCPARATLLTGKLAHNTNVTDLNPLYGI